MSFLITLGNGTFMVFLSTIDIAKMEPVYFCLFIINPALNICQTAVGGGSKVNIGWGLAKLISP